MGAHGRGYRGKSETVERLEMKPRFLSADDPEAPKYWRHETSGQLAPAVHAYLHGKPLTVRQVHLMRAYLWQWVKSPVWNAPRLPGFPGTSGMLEVLRLRVAAIQTQKDIEACIDAATTLGMDPL